MGDVGDSDIPRYFEEALEGQKGMAGAVDWRGGIDLIEGIDGIEKK